MKKAICFLVSVLFVFFFIPHSSLAQAHIGFGEYAGSYAVSLVPEPRSPFVGEEVAMTFYLRDLHGYFPQEPFVVAMVIQEVFPDDSERAVFATAPETITDGIYTTSYRFEKAGLYRVEFDFNKPDEPDVVRDAVFGIEVREIPITISYMMLLLVSLLVFFFAFLGGIVFARYYDGRTSQGAHPPKI